MTQIAEKLKRPSVPVMDDMLGEPYKALDHGFVRVIDYMGDTAAVVQAARVSYGEGTKTPSDDRGLIRYLMRHWHTTPFEMCELKLHLKMPLFVARQWVRHRTASMNEYSGRYSIMPNEFYVPSKHDIQRQSTTNKQGRTGDFDEDIQIALRETIRQQSEGAFQLYEELWTGWPFYGPRGGRWGIGLDMLEPHPHTEPNGMTRELARTILPLNAYTEFYWKIDVHNLLHFLRLRADGHAQKEIRIFADIICGIVHDWLPDVWRAFVDYQRDAVTFSKIEKDLLRYLLQSVDPAKIDGWIETNEALSKGEKIETNEKVRKLFPPHDKVMGTSLL